MRAKFFTALVGMAGIASAAPQADDPSGSTSSSDILVAPSSDILVAPSSSTAPSSSAASSSASASGAATALAATAITKIDNKVLILARDADGANSASAGLTAYGIPFEQVIIPQEGAALPTLNTSASEGKYSGIIIMDAVSYEYADGWRSAITTDQFNTIWAYQAGFKVRMVRINEFPGPLYGVNLAGAGGCCNTGVEQLISFTNTTSFPTANLKT